ncbi:competence protein ComGF [Cytobacillus eiseniae]|uniref:Competence protein ComGF n=2 Tax=Cytobacillus eiseniae TaxID=762947 RepID=A0ABS4RDQ2_9BACI|nr:competence protein ComGF [Cytobacillus eiseniae]
MVEMLLAFSLFLIIASLFSISLTSLLPNDQFDLRYKELEWHVFVAQLKKEIHSAEEMDVENNRLVIRVNGQNVQFDKHGTNIRRRVNDTGHEIVFQQVNSILFERLKDGMNLTVVDLQQQKYTAVFYSFLEMEENYAP